MEPKDFTIADLISFGQYLLSEERQNRTSEVLLRDVTHADVCNWQDENLKEIPETAEEIEAFEKKYSDEDFPELPKHLQTPDWMNEPVRYDCVDNDNHITLGVDEIEIGTPLASDGKIVISKKDLNQAIFFFNLRQKQ
jgi:hypothetical protein